MENRLAAAQQRLKRANKALVAKHTSGEWDEYHAAYAAVLVEERASAAAAGEEYAEPFGFPVQWDTGAPMPHLIVNDSRAFLMFLANTPDPAWDGTYVTMKSAADQSVESLGLVEFVRCVSATLGAPNDEVLSGHPLHGKGQEAYTAQVVRNSRWLAEIERINSIHPQYNAARWRNLNHYVFWFHDTTFECIAESYKVDLVKDSISGALARVCQRLTS